MLLKCRAPTLSKPLIQVFFAFWLLSNMAPGSNMAPAGTRVKSQAPGSSLAFGHDLGHDGAIGGNDAESAVATLSARGQCVATAAC